MKTLSIKRSPQINETSVDSAIVALQLFAIDPANVRNVKALLSVGALLGRLSPAEKAEVLRRMSATANNVPAGGGLR